MEKKLTDEELHLGQSFIAKEEISLSDFKTPDAWRSFFLLKNEFCTMKDLNNIFLEYVQSKKTNYHGDAFKGSACRKLLKEADKLEDPDLYKDFNGIDDDMSPVRLINWHTNPEFKNKLENCHNIHVILSCHVATPEELDNNVLLDPQEISKRIKILREEYQITGVKPPCLKDDFWKNIQIRFQENQDLKTELLESFKKVYRTR